MRRPGRVRGLLMLTLERRTLGCSTVGGRSPVRRGGPAGSCRRRLRAPIFVQALAALASAVLATGRASGQPPAAPARPPEVWAIVVGIGDYADPAIPDGRTAARDAQAVRRWMQQAGWDNRHQLLLSDFGSAQPGPPAAPAATILPSRQNLGWVFERWILENRAQAGDLVVFYFAGESRSVARSQGAQLDVRHYLLPQDADPERLEQTGW